MDLFLRAFEITCGIGLGLAVVCAAFALLDKVFG